MVNTVCRIETAVRIETRNQDISYIVKLHLLTSVQYVAFGGGGIRIALNNLLIF